VKSEYLALGWSEASDVRQPLKIYRDPVPASRSGRRAKYPFADMKVGDCFYVPALEAKSPNVLAAAARQWAKRNGKSWKFAARETAGMVGIWRVE
jgi:hypothetical protein